MKEISAMRNLSHYRRAILHPLNSQAENDIQFCEMNDDTALQILKLDSDSDISALWSCEVFNEINSEIRVIIDDHEEEEIPSARMADVIRVIEKNCQRTSDPFALKLMAGFRSICLASLFDGYPVYIVL